MKYGYCRISQGKQSIERQIRNIKAVDETAVIVKEIHTRTSFEGRKEWNKIMRVIKEGDTIYFDSVSRMSGNVEEGCSIYEELFNKGVNLVFLKESHINTDVYKKALNDRISLEFNTGDKATDNLMNSIIDALNRFTIDLAKQQIRLAFTQAEKEVQDLHQRTKEGIETARLNGKQIGRKQGDTYITKKEKHCRDIILNKSKDFNGSNTDIELMAILGISRNSYYKYKNNLKNEIL